MSSDSDATIVPERPYKPYTPGREGQHFDAARYDDTVYDSSGQRIPTIDTFYLWKRAHVQSDKSDNNRVPNTKSIHLPRYYCQSIACCDDTYGGKDRLVETAKKIDDMVMKRLEGPDRLSEPFFSHIQNTLSTDSTFDKCYRASVEGSQLFKNCIRDIQAACSVGNNVSPVNSRLMDVTQFRSRYPEDFKKLINILSKDIFTTILPHRLEDFREFWKEAHNESTIDIDIQPRLIITSFLSRGAVPQKTSTANRWKAVSASGDISCQVAFENYEYEWNRCKIPHEEDMQFAWAMRTEIDKAVRRDEYCFNTFFKPDKSSLADPLTYLENSKITREALRSYCESTLHKYTDEYKQHITVEYLSGSEAKEKYPEIDKDWNEKICDEEEYRDALISQCKHLESERSSCTVM
ncbi:uncharacterized protein IL334_002167 [Kwoniella shivajii]|uniref:Uncharacterized protein n=1 Tax=Kwoniella shivajii TaxID=564305 RepID=A0ABZ1CVM4_9TREE|nr:hypothetical protein IL334_002167 [Kwoniella shivajii]